MLLSVILLLAPAFLSAQHGLKVGDQVAEKSKQFDAFHVFHRDGQEWDRVVFQTISGDNVRFHSAYCDKQGQIKMVLPEGYGFEYQQLWVIDTTYDSPMSDFHEGMAVVRSDSNGQFGFVDKQGKIAIAAEHTILGPFSEGLAYFGDLSACMGENAIEGRVGYLNMQGEVVIELPSVLSKLYGCCYFHGEPFKAGKAVMYTREFGFDCNSHSQITVNKAGEIIEYDGNLLDPYNQPVKLD